MLKWSMFIKVGMGIVYKFQRGQCDAGFVGYTLNHLHQCYSMEYKCQKSAFPVKVKVKKIMFATILFK